MDPSIPMILPKGFVRNSNEIYQEVAKYPVLPPEKTHEYWLVYNTTFTQLKDPTARRLENFWWRVWGSDRKKLSGKTLARRFEDISTRPPFVHIPGPPNRWEPPPEVITLLQALQKHREEAQREQDRSSSGKNRIKGKGKSDPSVKALASSASKPPPMHPILKKCRGDSKSGPRPTARFNVPESGNEEDEKSKEDSSSGSTSAKGLQMRSASSMTATPPKSDKKRTPTPTKKFLANTSTKRRPTLPRRPSSQSSTSSEITAREGPGSAASRHVTTQRTVEPIAEQGGAGDATVSQVAEVSAPQGSAASSKTAGKRTGPRSPTTKRFSQADLAQLGSVGGSTLQKKGQTGAPSAQEKGKGKEQVPMAASSPSTGDSSAVVKPKLQRVQSSDLASKTSKAPSPMTRSHSHLDTRKARDSGRSLPVGLTSGAATTKTSTDPAAGTIIGIDEPYPDLPTRLDEENSDHVQQSSSSSLLDSRFVPTQPSTAPTLPLGRTKSQLTLLLEKEKERKGGK